MRVAALLKRADAILQKGKRIVAKGPGKYWRKHGGWPESGELPEEAAGRSLGNGRAPHLFCYRPVRLTDV
jgi:hypothetical protein